MNDSILYSRLYFIPQQVALQQQNRLDILQGGQLSQRKEVTELSMEATYLKKYITERFRYYHNDAAGDPARNTLGKTTNLFLPYDNYFKVSICNR